MSTGNLQLYLSGHGSIDLLYENSLPEITLGGSGHPTSYSVVFEHSLKASVVDRALLEVGIRASSMEIPRWKISFNDVVLTREFKPLICVETSNGFFCKLVFDVTPIVTSKQKREHRVEIEYIGVKEFTLDHIGLLMLGSYEAARSLYGFWSGAISLQPGSSVDITLPQRFDHAKARIVAYLPHTDASLVVGTDSGTTVISRSTGMNEFTVELEDVSYLRLEHQGSGGYYPKEVLVSSILVYKIEVPEPSIEVSYNLDNSSVELNISNNGSDAAENVVVVSIAVGNVIDRKVLGELKPGQSQTIALSIKQGSTNTIRVIWKHRGKTMFKDIKVKS